MIRLATRPPTLSAVAPLLRATAAPLLTVALATVTPTAGTAASTVKIRAAVPGIYAVTAERLAAVEGWPSTAVPSAELRLRHRTREVPLWIEDGGDGMLGPGDRVLFAVAPELFHPTSREQGAGPRVFLLSSGASSTDESPPSTTLAAGSPSLPATPPSLSTTPLRRVHLERDLLRVPLTSTEAAAGLESLWYWGMVTEHASSSLTIDLGPLADRLSDGDPELGLAIDLLGWSETPTPEGVFQHRVEVLLNERAIAEGEWDGRRRHRLRIERVPAELLGDRHRLTVRIERRTLPGDEIPLVDSVYVDSIELRYRAASPLIDPEHPLVVAPAREPRWLPDPESPPGSRALSTAGWTAQRDTRQGVAGWLVPATTTESLLWIVDDETLREPLEIAPLRTGARSLPADTEYVMIAPGDLLPGVEPLVELHRRRGLRVEAIDVEAIYDGLGAGERSPAAIRRFLERQRTASGALRYVLLVGDGDWLPIVDPASGRTIGPPGRERIPTYTYLSDFGPAATDHYFVMADPGSAVPELAVGRLPVIDAEELAATVAKIVRHVEARPRAGAPSVLMLSDRTVPSTERRRRLMQRLEDVDVELLTLAEVSRTPPDLAVIEALDRQPTLAFFGGHGSRLNWELGEPGRPSPETFFDLDDLSRLAPADRLPIVVAASCATAPFDHPNAGSLGEAMMSAPDRGAIAYVGASAMLFTPIRFGDHLVRALASEPTLGDALVRAKRETAVPRVSFLYNLLGDPALPLR